MSRHKLVKTMDLDDELDAYDGAHYNDNLDVADERKLSDSSKKDKLIASEEVTADDKGIPVYRSMDFASRKSKANSCRASPPRCYQCTSSPWSVGQRWRQRHRRLSLALLLRRR